jgi:sulfur relay (sulfurtransferase) complex TusBCD TusD component (DsrE family)
MVAPQRSIDPVQTKARIAGFPETGAMIEGREAGARKGGVFMMSRLRVRALTILAATLLALPLLATASARADDAKPGLFVNLTTDDTWSAAKAIFFAHEKALKNGHAPVAIWLNVRAVYLADKNRPSNVHGLMREADQSIQDMLTAFMDDDGVVIMCQACSKAAGLTAGDYIDGVTMGTWEVVSGYLFDPAVKTLAW